MPTESEVWKSRAPRRLRAGIIIGSAIALIGITVGTATGAVTPFQQVVVVNTPASPIPIVGTVNVGNTPANQNVTVSNFPATQAVSGSVSVTNVANRAFRGYRSIGEGDGYTFNIPNGINASMVRVGSRAITDDSVVVWLIFGDGLRTALYQGDTDFTHDFTLPAVINGVEVLCTNQFVNCDIEVDVIGY